jgi:2-oxo-4-hydroxy-4-carboxy-5-ureidoimidazoline decarboxylase
MAEPTRDAAAHEWLDFVPTEVAREMLLGCCGSRRWVSGMLDRRPFGSALSLRSAAHTVWAGLAREDYLEAFSCHPPIGGNLADLHAKFAPTPEQESFERNIQKTDATPMKFGAIALGWSSEEQSGVGSADEQTLLDLAAANRAYCERFGFTFIICATGKSAREMLEALRARLANDPAVELLQAAAEQAQITWLRLEKVCI